MSALEPYVFFDGDCAEAMATYQGCFGGTLTLVRVGDLPSPPPGNPRTDLITYARLVAGDLIFSGSDWLATSRERRVGTNIALLVTAPDLATLDRYFSTLEEGGPTDERQSPSEMSFGTYGALTDRFGVRWMFRAPLAEKAGD
ncbi:MAG: VOC family protein [Acidimicrobiales bacterium]